MEEKLKVLVLGGTGIIGQELCGALLRHGYTPYSLSRRLQSNPMDGVTYVAGDMYKSQELPESIRDTRFDAVIDLLSFTPDQLKSSLNMFVNRCGQYIFVSSATIYEGASEGELLTEDSPRVTEGWSYPLMKIKSEEYLKKFCSNGKLSYTIVRPYITYSEKRLSFGEWESSFVIQRLKDGRPIVIGDELANTETTLTHSYDLADGIAGLVGKPGAYGEDFHITSDEHVTWGQVFATTADILKVENTVVDAPVQAVLKEFPELTGKIGDRCKRRLFDNTKLRRVYPNYSPKYGLQEGYNKILPSFNIEDEGGYLLQGRMDTLALKYSKDKSHRKAIAKWCKSIARRRSAGEVLKYRLGRARRLYKIAKRIKQLIRGREPNHYV